MHVCNRQLSSTVPIGVGFWEGVAEKHTPLNDDEDVESRYASVKTATKNVEEFTISKHQYVLNTKFWDGGLPGPEIIATNNMTGAVVSLKGRWAHRLTKQELLTAFVIAEKFPYNVAFSYPIMHAILGELQGRLDVKDACRLLNEISGAGCWERPVSTTKATPSELGKRTRV